MDNLTAYLTVHDSLLSCYGTSVRGQNPHRNGRFLGLELHAEGFRGRVSQIRILPGPL
jgi:hypothetical protein